MLRLGFMYKVIYVKIRGYIYIVIYVRIRFYVYVSYLC